MKSQKGISMVEILLAFALVGILVLLIGSLPSSIRLIGKAKHQSLAREIASKQIEDKRVITFANLADTVGDAISDSRLGLLPSGTGTIVIQNCASLPPGDSQKTKYCPNSESLKIVSIKIDWNETGKPQSLKMTTLIADGGLK